MCVAIKNIVLFLQTHHTFSDTAELLRTEAKAAKRQLALKAAAEEMKKYRAKALKAEEKAKADGRKEDQLKIRQLRDEAKEVEAKEAEAKEVEEETGKFVIIM